jgi:pyruvate dehydrogenase E2 component (dihydrolipoamide acetyltransferase)
MPSLGADMEAGTLVEWLKQPGDRVARGDIIAIVDTQKGAIEVEVFEDGVVERLLVAPGQQVPVGTMLAVIAGGEAPVAAGAAEAAAPLPAAIPEAAAEPSGALPPRAPVPEAGRARLSPAARKLAGELGIDAGTVMGTGPDGAITRADIERAAAAAKETVTARAGARDRLSDMRAAIAAAMARSKREIPHLYLATTVDVTRARAWLTAQNEQRPMPDRLLLVVLLVKGVALALREIPELNGFWIDGKFRPGQGIHVGCAVALRGGGLVAPALRDVDRKDVGAIMRELRDLVARARAGTLRSSELSDPTITVTNLGELGVEAAFGIINPPQVALVSFGAVVERPWAVDGTVDVRPMITSTLSADHRVIDGHRAGLFLAAVGRYLQDPDKL